MANGVRNDGWDAAAVSALAGGVRAGERRALARALTLVESARADHRAAAENLLAQLKEATGGALRLALTGAPGVGKSTFIETFGLMLCAEEGSRLAVLAIDPSSRRSGGSILGDKTRMERLARHPSAYIRPSAAQTTLGGVARRTREAILLCEAWGASVVIVETVGVGQSETAAAEMTDVFALLVGPGGGDELQGVKRGVMEMADAVVVTKADGRLLQQASLTAADYAGALRLLRKRAYDPDAGADPVPWAMAVSALDGAGLGEFWRRVTALDAWRRESGWRDRRRAEQNVAWMRSEIETGLMDAFKRSAGGDDALTALERRVADGDVSPGAAANEALRRYWERRGAT